MEDLVGYGFRPTDDELVGYYLHNKILGKNWLVEGAINEVNICSFDPWNLRFQSKIKSRDPMWYFFSRRENKYTNGNRQSRTTDSGFWKVTGEHVDVKDQWGTWCTTPGKIGHKRVLVFLKGRISDKTKSDWVIHEFHDDLLPEHQAAIYLGPGLFCGQPITSRKFNQNKEKVIYSQKSEYEWKMAEDSIKKPLSNNTVKQSWIVLEKRSQRNAQWNYLKNMIIGVLLFISIIGSIILVG